MHNGLKIEPLSYYGYPMLNMLMKTKGIHEPQEERAFLNVLEVLPSEPKMLELGSYWSFYSMCFLRRFPQGESFLVEPTAEGLEFGKSNFRINSLEGNFLQAYIGAQDGIADDGIDVISVDAFMDKNAIDFVDILHADIQSHELLMLRGAQKLLSEKKAGYIFISTHSNELHYGCKRTLEENGFEIVASLDIEQTYSFDGLIVAKNPKYPGVEPLKLSEKPRIVT
jgi:hypothetical protein